MNLKYMKVSLFEISYKKKLTFSPCSNFLDVRLHLFWVVLFCFCWKNKCSPLVAKSCMWVRTTTVIETHKHVCSHACIDTYNIKPAELLPTAGKPHSRCKWDEREVWVHGSHANVMETSKTEVINRLTACGCLNEHYVALKATHMTHSRANVHTLGHMKGRFGVHTSECSKRHVTQLNRGL